MSLLGNWDDIFNKGISRVEAYDDVDRIDEVIKLLKLFRNARFYKNLTNVYSDGKNILASDNNWRMSFKDIPNFNIALKGFGRFEAPFYLPPITKVICFTQLRAMYLNVGLSYVYSSGHRLTERENKSLLLGDIGERVTFFVEDYDVFDDPPEFSVDFFKRLKNVKWENKRARKLNSYIYDVILTIGAEIASPTVHDRTLGHGTIYLIGCNALKNDRDILTCEDVVTAFLTTFKIFMSDLRPLIPLIDEE